LRRELLEELECSVTDTHFEGTFTDNAAGMPETTVTVRLYAGRLVGTPRPSSEIEELAWIDVQAPAKLPLAPSLTNKILPFLNRRQSPCPSEVTTAPLRHQVHP
jgi:8-oxo-dGTP diphosphatase